MKNLRKAVLASITPKYCELIVSGQKTVELRKTRPKIDTPFKVYIYQTKGKWIYKILGWLSLHQGKVIGEFVCDDISLALCYPYPKSFSNRPLFFEKIVPQTCLSMDEIEKYGNGEAVYGWHISDLKIYDEPKELSEFLKYNRTEDDCYFQHLPKPKSCQDCIKKCSLKRPPQSWCYVEDLEVIHNEKNQN